MVDSNGDHDDNTRSGRVGQGLAEDLLRDGHPRPAGAHLHELLLQRHGPDGRAQARLLDVSGLLRRAPHLDDGRPLVGASAGPALVKRARCIDTELVRHRLL